MKKRHFIEIRCKKLFLRSLKTSKSFKKFKKRKSLSLKLISSKLTNNELCDCPEFSDE